MASKTGTTILSANQIRTKIRKAKNGNQKELDLLIKVNIKEADRANKRLKTQARKTPDAYAFQQVKTYLKQTGKNSFSKSKKYFASHLDELQQQLLMLNFYNQAKTGYVKGAIEVEDQNYQRLREMYGAKLDQIDKDLIKQFFRSDLFKEYKKFDSESAIYEGLDAILRGRTQEDLQEAWNDYMNHKELTLDEVWESWVNQDVSGDKQRQNQ